MTDDPATTGQSSALSLPHLVLRPRAAPPGGAAPPLLLLLHGRGSDERDLLGLAGALDPRFLVVSARAPDPLPPGYHWYDLLAVGRPEPQSFARSRALLERFVGEAVGAYGADPGRVFSLGFSQGAVMTGTLLLTRPDLIAGAVLLSGYLPLRSGLAIDAAALRGKPVFVGHGSADPVISVDFGREAEAFLGQAGADLTYHEGRFDHRITPEELAAVAAWLTARLGAPAPSTT
jgi:phospholipase/carboxylesterase